MHITKTKITNFKTLRNVSVEFGKDLNLIVGDNESGKSTLLEAINLAVSGQINGRNASYELHPFFFNLDTVNAFLADLINGKNPEPPKIVIEVFFDDDPLLVRMKGSINSEKANCPGITYTIEFNNEYAQEYAEYIRNPADVVVLPIEYYKTSWYFFSNKPASTRSSLVKASLVDTTQMHTYVGPNRYILEQVNRYLEPEQRARLSLSYRRMKDSFMQDEAVVEINNHLSKAKGKVSDKNISVSLDSTNKSSWEAGIVPHLDSIPFALSGRGEQNSINIRLAIDKLSDTNVYLIEEPENHLSHSNLNRLIADIAEHVSEGQTIISTHNSYVMNKLGIDDVILFTASKNMRLGELSPSTRDYFMKLPGHDTLRLVLSERVILVEGPSDELIVKRAYFDRHGREPLEDGIDIISVNALAFKRFLEITELLGVETTVVTDNDGSVEALKKKYVDYNDNVNIQITYSKDESLPTLEPQIVAANSLDLLNTVLGTKHDTKEDLASFMQRNKTECALRILEADQKITYPDYVLQAI